MVLLKFLVICVSGKSFSSDDFVYGCLSHIVIAEFLEQSLWVVLMYAQKSRWGDSGVREIICLLEAIRLKVWDCGAGSCW